jgi:arginine deiminase
MRTGDDSVVQVSFDIDPSMSKVNDEHIKLAQYLKERYLTVDIFDA